MEGRQISAAEVRECGRGTDDEVGLDDAPARDLALAQRGKAGLAISSRPGKVRSRSKRFGEPRRVDHRGGHFCAVARRRVWPARGEDALSTYIACH